MSDLAKLDNQVRANRARRGWSQDELAARSGLSRAGVSAIETGRLIPSTAAALALAVAFGCRVEDLFRPAGPELAPEDWAWPPSVDPCRYWRAEVGGRIWRYPVETTPAGTLAHDGVCHGGAVRDHALNEPRDTLVIACCDPAVGLLAAGLRRAADVRLIALPRSSRAALSLLGRGLVHAAGVHLSRDGDRAGNEEAVRSELGCGYRLLRVASWEEGVASKPARRIASIGAAVRGKLRWVGREAGSGARQCLDELLGDRRPPRHLASDHRGVADAVRSGWADAGVCVRLVSEEAGLSFLAIRREPYDLCFPDALRDDPRIRAMIEVVRSADYRRIVGELPGYLSAQAGELMPVG